MPGESRIRAGERKSGINFENLLRENDRGFPLFLNRMYKKTRLFRSGFSNFIIYYSILQIKFYSLCQWQLGSIVDGIGLSTHIDLPGI